MAPSDTRVATLGRVIGHHPATDLAQLGPHRPVRGRATLSPSSSLLDRLIGVGLRLTTGSDAHQPDQIGHRFDLLRAELEGRGIDAVTAFSRRQPFPVPLGG